MAPSGAGIVEFLVSSGWAYDQPPRHLCYLSIDRRITDDPLFWLDLRRCVVLALPMYEACQFYPVSLHRTPRYS
jgi:hypothetical protein